MKEIISYFLRLGCLGFGGPLAVIADMQRDLVVQRKWISEGEFSTLLPLIKAMPGPVAFQLAVFLAYRRKAFWGALAAAICLVTPAFLLVILIAHFEASILQNPFLNAVMRGFEIGALALIAAALMNLTQNQTQKPHFWFCVFAAIISVQFLHLSEALVVLFTLIVSLLYVYLEQRKKSQQAGKPLLEAGSLLTILALVIMALKAGALVFGTGLAIVPLLESTVVEQMQWLSHEQFLQALAIGQITPGPVIISVSYIAFQVAGFWAAVLATVAVFLPAFIHMVTWFPRTIGWLQKQKWISFVSSCLIGSVVGVIALVTWKLFLPLTVTQMLIALALFALVTIWKKPSWFCLLFAGMLGVMWLQ